MDDCLGTVWVCTDCMLVEANGECDPYRPEDLPEPLSAIPARERLTLGMGWEDHGCGRTEQSWRDGVECDCEVNPFSTSACDGCGDWHHGERHAMTAWKVSA